MRIWIWEGWDVCALDHSLTHIHTHAHAHTLSVCLFAFPFAFPPLDLHIPSSPSPHLSHPIPRPPCLPSPTTPRWLTSRSTGMPSRFFRKSRSYIRVSACPHTHIYSLSLSFSLPLTIHEPLPSSAPHTCSRPFSFSPSRSRSIYAVIVGALGGAGWYLTRLARGPDGKAFVSSLFTSANRWGPCCSSPQPQPPSLLTSACPAAAVRTQPDSPSVSLSRARPSDALATCLSASTDTLTD